MERKMSTVFVDVVRKNKKTSFGFGIGTAETGEKVVTHVNDDGPGAGKLLTEDNIYMINGVLVKPLTHDELIQLVLKNTTLKMEVQREAAASASPPPATVTRHYDNLRSTADIMVPMEGMDTTGEQVTVSRPDLSTSFGFQLIRIGDEPNDSVKHVTYGSPSDGLLQIGDTIIVVNGKRSDELTHEQVIEEIVKGLSVTFIVGRVASSEC
eukprot:m.53666 g.53666  ORF g.53666 m.53666 type:complete len:210 (+) comp21797_c0_seq1:152-781(+)